MSRVLGAHIYVVSVLGHWHNSASVLVLFWGSGTSSERRHLDSWVYGGFLAGSTRWRCPAFRRSPDGVESPFAQPGLSELKVPLAVRLEADRGRAIHRRSRQSAV
mmetsp:Transcript_28560/g.75342  ORF Transcript_28560/g.75342 Transcript_28560/m.75342 type:complete len:105 (+) Transcript_28560:2556-2870(+)